MIQNENELLFDCTLTVTGFNNTKETNSAFRKDLRRKIMSDGFKVNFLRGRQFDGFATATVSKRTGLRNLERGINSESLAAVFPFVFTSIIEPDGFTLGYDYYPVILDIWKRDNQQYINSNMMVIGKSGSGKSFFTKTLLSLIYSENSRIYILDPENEYLNLCRKVHRRRQCDGGADQPAAHLSDIDRRRHTCGAGGRFCGTPPIFGELFPDHSLRHYVGQPRRAQQYRLKSV